MGKTNDVDAYRQKATEIFRTTYSKVTIAQRQHAKMVMMAEAYGLRTEVLSDLLADRESLSSALDTYTRRV